MKNIRNNDLGIQDVSKIVTVYGWAHRVRDLGGLLFIDLRDRSGIVQLVIDPQNKFYETALKIRNEFVLKVTGEVVERTTPNPSLPTGEIEIQVFDLEVLNESAPLPIEINSEVLALEDTRLRYRYLDLRREEMKRNLLVRHQVCQITREYFNGLDFVEVETPVLCKSTPEGARDYLVPSRVSHGKYYALPQSPQILKQLLMVGGMERYYQIAKCFRDEDLRADRQPEFTQIDLEMSFVEEEDIYQIVEDFLKTLFRQVKGIEQLEFPRMTYKEAMDLYGSDKPDTRFAMTLIDLSSVFHETSFQIFKDQVVNAIVVKGQASNFSRKDIDHLTEYVKTFGAKGLAWMKYTEDVFTGGVSKNLSEQELQQIKELGPVENGDLILIVADTYAVTKQALGNLRLKLAKDLSLIDPDQYCFLWVTNFPMFEYRDEDQKYYAIHHPFTSPDTDDPSQIVREPLTVLSRSYDIVLNGYELGGGSIRIHKQAVQNAVFDVLGLTKDEISEKFGFLVNAFQYGCPPHGGLAFGLERLVMLLCGTDNIRDVIAFPKTASASDLMSEAPNVVDPKQLEELKIKNIDD